MSLADKLTEKQEAVIRGWVGGLTNAEMADIHRVTVQAISHRGVGACKALGAETPMEACYLWGKHESSS